jgi:hypothetical protein
MGRKELIPILEKFGFKEVTHVRYPLHWAKYLKKGDNEHLVKREFRYGRCYVLFDYINIEVRYNSLQVVELTNISEVLSLLFFLSYKSKKRFNGLGLKQILTLFDDFNDEMRYFDCYREPTKKRLNEEKAKFEKIRQNCLSNI